MSDEGTEHIGPEDTFDTDYGRLLEAVQNRGKGLASPRGTDHILRRKYRLVIAAASRYLSAR